jgi:hypothetical protein
MKNSFLLYYYLIFLPYNTSHFSAAAPIAKDSPLPKDFKTVSAIWLRGSRPPVTKQTTTTGAVTGSSGFGSSRGGKGNGITTPSTADNGKSTILQPIIYKIPLKMNFRVQVGQYTRIGSGQVLVDLGPFDGATFEPGNDGLAPNPRELVWAKLSTHAHRPPAEFRTRFQLAIASL